jgi:hypothetical protein
VGPCGKSQFIDADFQQLRSGAIELTELANLLAGHLRVVENFGSLETFGLGFAGIDDLFPNVVAGGSRNGGGQLLKFRGGNFHVNVNPIEQRSSLVFIPLYY